MVSSWITRQNKPVLIGLAEDAGLDLSDPKLTKPQVAVALEKHLQAHAAQFSSDPAFEDFYTTARRTPLKSRDPDSEVKSIVRTGGRRSTKAKPEPVDNSDSDDSSSASPPSQGSDVMTTSPTTRAPDRPTPTTTRIRERPRSLPPSPDIVVDDIEDATARFYAGLDDLYTLSGIPDAIDWARESCSSIATVHLVFLLMEALGLSNAVIPWKYIFDFPSIHLIGAPSFAVKIPDLFVLLSASFWAPVLLWSATSIFIPLLFAYFFNLTVHTVRRNNARVRVVRYNYDPFTYNVAKFMVVSTVYGAGILQGYVSDQTVATVDNSQFSGFASMLVGTYVCGLCSFWQATQR